MYCHVAVNVHVPWGQHKFLDSVCWVEAVFDSDACWFDDESRSIDRGRTRSEHPLKPHPSGFLMSAGDS